jgi:hypothetical protein
VSGRWVRKWWPLYRREMRTSHKGVVLGRDKPMDLSASKEVEPTELDD